jgi:hypothetical protein
MRIFTRAVRFVALVKSSCQALKFGRGGEICMRKAVLPSAVIFVKRHEIASPKEINFHRDGWYKSTICLQNHVVVSPITETGDSVIRLLEVHFKKPAC